MYDRDYMISDDIMDPIHGYTINAIASLESITRDASMLMNINEVLWCYAERQLTAREVIWHRELNAHHWLEGEGWMHWMYIHRWRRDAALDHRRGAWVIGLVLSSQGVMHPMVWSDAPVVNGRNMDWCQARIGLEGDKEVLGLMGWTGHSDLFPMAHIHVSYKWTHIYTLSIYDIYCEMI